MCDVYRVIVNGLLWSHMPLHFTRYTLIRSYYFLRFVKPPLVLSAASKFMQIAEQRGVVTFQGKPITLMGNLLAVGQPLPDVTLTDASWKRVALSSFAGKPLLLSIIPSLDTGICDAQTRRFNAEAEQVGADAHVITISADLPWRLASWAKDAEVKRITLLSDHLDMAFGNAAGTHVKELRIDARAIFVADAAGIVRYVELVPEIAQHPDYDLAIDTLKELTEDGRRKTINAPFSVSRPPS